MSALSNALEQIWDGQLGCYDAETVALTINRVVVTVACAGGELVKDNDMVIGGLMDGPAAAVSVKRSLFTTEPSEKDYAVYRGKNFKVGRIRSSPDNTVLILDLVPRK